MTVGGEGLALHIALEALGDGSIGFEIYSGEGEAALVHSQGRAVLAAAAAPVVDLAALKAREPEAIMPAEQVYAAFERMGLRYGASFRGVRQLMRSRDASGAVLVLGELHLPAALGSGRADYVLHPSLLDAALQASLGLVEGGGETLLPFALDRLEVYAALPEAVWVLVRPRSEGTNGLVHKLDLELVDEGGRVCARLTGFTSRVLERSAPHETLFLAPRWQAQRLEEPASGVTVGERHVLLCEGIGAAFEGDERGLRLTSQAPSLSARYGDYAAQLLQKLQAVLARRPQGEVLLQLVVPSAGEGALLRGLGGMLLSAAQENPKLRGQLIGVEADLGSEALAALLQAEAGSGAGAVRYVGGERQALRLEEVACPSAAALPWRDGGVYLITGGAGGLGLLFAEAIAKEARDTTLILTGRSELSDGARARLQALPAQVDYRALDVCDASGLERLVAEIVGSHGGLKGVIHSAGVLRDSFVLKKTEAELRAVLAPKVAGLLALDAATRDEALDFFVLFSSVAGVFGNIGQADYAAANGFLDAYADFRDGLVACGERSGRTLSLNWPLWAQGGMQVDGATLAAMRRHGLMPLASEAGLTAFAQALAFEGPQIAVLAGDAGRIRQKLLATPAAVEQPVKTAVATDIASDILEDKTIRHLTRLLASALKLPADRIDASEALESYGIDSVMVMALTASLEESFGPLPKTLFFEYQSIAALSELFPHPARDRLIGLLGLGKAEAAQVARPLELSAPQQGRRLRRPLIRTAPTVSQASKALDIAIIGMSGRYPKANDLAEFWANLRDGRDCISEIPRSAGTIASISMPSGASSAKVIANGAVSSTGLMSLIPCSSTSRRARRSSWTRRNACFCRPAGRCWRMPAIRARHWAPDVTDGGLRGRPGCSWAPCMRSISSMARRHRL